MTYITCSKCGHRGHISTWKMEKKISGNEAEMSCPSCGNKVVVRV